IRTLPTSAPRAATARPPHRRPGGARARAAARSRGGAGGDVASDERLFDAHVRRALGDRQGRLSPLAAAAAHLVPAEVTGDVVDPIQRLEQVAAEPYVLHELCQVSGPAHSPVARRN